MSKNIAGKNYPQSLFQGILIRSIITGILTGYQFLNYFKKKIEFEFLI